MKAQQNINICTVGLELFIACKQKDDECCIVCRHRQHDTKGIGSLRGCYFASKLMLQLCFFHSLTLQKTSIRIPDKHTLELRINVNPNFLFYTPTKRSNAQHLVEY